VAWLSGRLNTPLPALGGARAGHPVPSVLVPDEASLLINPDHPDTARIRAGIVRNGCTTSGPYDQRPRQP